MRVSLARAAFACAALSLIGCATPGKFVWVDAYDGSAEPAEAYRIGPGDVISVQVLNQQEASASRVKVRADGKITLPLLGEVSVTELTPTAASARLEERLKTLFQNPVVTVQVDEPRPFTVAVLGEVNQQGNYVLEAGAGVLQALASAGGLTQYAHEDMIYVLRKQDPASPPVRIRFSYPALSRAEGTAATFRLRPRDVIVVE